MEGDDSLSFLRNGINFLKIRANSDNTSDCEQNFMKRLHEKDIALQELRNEYEELEKSIEAEERKLSEFEKTLQMESMILDQEQRNACEKAEKIKSLRNIENQYKQRMMKASAKPSSNDMQTIESYKRKLTAYKRLTGVVWDYTSCNETTLTGYIKDNNGSKMQIFRLNIKGKSQEEIVTHMWNLIEKKSS